MVPDRRPASEGERARLVAAVRGLVVLAVVVGVAAGAFWVLLPDGVGSLPAALGGAGEEQTPVVPADPMTPVPTVEARPAATPEPTPTATRAVDNPWGREAVVVAVEDRTDLDRPFVRAVRDAADFWERHPDLAGYPFEFVVRPDAADPDVVVRYADTFVCGEHADPKGCAPVLSPGVDPPDPVVVQVGATPDGNLRTDRNAAIHELGHVLGRSHCDDPAWVMGIGCPDAPDRPNATDGNFAWRETTLRVHLDYDSVEANRTVVEQQVRLALAAFAAGEGTAPANLTFRRVEDPYLADVRIRMGVEDGCAGQVRGCADLAGADLDGDGAAEYYTRASVALEPVPVGETGWHLGRWLAAVFTPGDTPGRFLSLPDDGPWWAGIPGSVTDGTTTNATDAGRTNATGGATTNGTDPRSWSADPRSSATDPRSSPAVGYGRPGPLSPPR